MQPYIFPYVGYFQLINSVDEFVIYDNIKYTKRGWINRNRILVNGKDTLFSIPIENDSDYLNVVDRKLAYTWAIERKKILNKIYSNYNKSEFFNESFDVIKKCLMQDEYNLFNFIFNSLSFVNDYIGISTQLIISSTIDIDHTLKSENKVIAICQKQNAERYINAIGGMVLYDKSAFKNANIELNFIKSNPIVYKQFDYEFVPWLSIIDVMMHNSKEKLQEHLKNYLLI